MGSSKSPGEATSNRLAGRLDRKQLQRMSMPGGGEVYKGPVASRALKAMGARAMTLDRAIIVGDDFNPGRPEDQALFAHEQHHLNAGGGEGGHQGRDAEEIEARAVEAMVFHRAAAGGYEGGYEDRGGAAQGNQHGAQDQNSGQARSGTNNANDTSDSNSTKADPGRGYMAMLAQGYNHQDVVEELARRAVAALDEREQVKTDRQTDKKGWF